MLNGAGPIMQRVAADADAIRKEKHGTQEDALALADAWSRVQGAQRIGRAMSEMPELVDLALGLGTNGWCASFLVFCIAGAHAMQHECCSCPQPGAVGWGNAHNKTNKLAKTQSIWAAASFVLAAGGARWVVP